MVESRIQCDVVTIGGGPGATPGAQLLARNGLKVVIVEKESGLGGTCLFEGCIPSKILLETARRRHQYEQNQEFGLSKASPLHLDLNQLMERKAGILNTRAQGARQVCEQLHITILHGEADFLSPHEVVVRRHNEPDVVVTATYIVAAPGSTSSLPPIPGADAPGVWSSVDALKVSEIPESITIIGGGYIGCELATLFTQLGTEVYLLESLPRILSTEDPYVAQAVRSSLEMQQVKITERAMVTKIEQDTDAGWTVRYQTADTEYFIHSQRVLIATGRRPNTKNIQWETAGIQLGSQGEIPVNEYSQTRVAHIYAPGDVNARVMLAHAATRQSLLAAQHILGKKPAVLLDNFVVPHVIFTDPEVASVGADSRALEQNPSWRMTRRPYARTARALIVGDNMGFAQVIWDSLSGRIKGMQVAGEQAGELILTATHAMTHGQTLDDLAQTVHPHPVLYEVISELIAMAQQEQMSS